MVISESLQEIQDYIDQNDMSEYILSQFGLKFKFSILSTIVVS